VKIKIVLSGNSSRNRPPDAEIRINHVVVYRGAVDGYCSYIAEIAVNKDLARIDIIHQNKVNEDTVTNELGEILADRSLELRSIELNEVPVSTTVLYNMPFFVEWPDNIQQDYISRGEQTPESISNTLYFGFNGRYQFEFLTDPDLERFRQLWLDEEQAHRNQTMTVDNEEVFDRYGDLVKTTQDFNLTIHDLREMIEKD